MSTDYRIATYAEGVAGLTRVRDLLEVEADPHPTPFFEYTENVGADGTGAPIEHGLPRCIWKYEFVFVEDYATLLSYCTGASAQVYIRTRKNDDSFGDFLVLMKRPRGDPPENGLVYNVEIEYVNLIAV